MHANKRTGYDKTVRNPRPRTLKRRNLAGNTIEAKFIADQLIEQGIPAVADRRNGNFSIGGWRPEMWGYGPKVRVREDDLPRAQAWLKAYEHRRKSRQQNLD